MGKMDLYLFCFLIFSVLKFCFFIFHVFSFFFVFFSTLKHIRISYRGGHNVRHFGDELHQDLGHWSTNCPTGQFFVPQNGQFRYLKFAIR